MLRVSLLGNVLVIHDGEPVRGFVSNKALALLCYLMVRNRLHSRHELAGLLWGEDSEEKAKNSLRVALSNLRRLFPDYFDISRQSVTFLYEKRHWLDVREFDVLTRSLKKASQKKLEAAVGLYRGDFMEDFFIEGTLAFEEWLDGQRAWWRERALASLAELNNQYLGAGKNDSAEKLLRRQLEMEPWDETAHRQLMKALSRQGDFNGALAHYEASRRVLKEELGVEPMSETTALYERILVAREMERPPLPEPSSPLVGRQKELHRIDELLRNSECRLLTLIGLGGIGKTTLALEAVRRSSQEHALLFINGAIFVPLTGVMTIESLPATIAKTLGLRLSRQLDPVIEVLDYLRYKELLLVLDNFDHLIPGTELLSQILRDCPDVKLLVTSREALNIATEWRLEVDGLPYPKNGRVRNGGAWVAEELLRYEAVQLFVNVAKQVRSDYKFTDIEAPFVGRLIQLVAGMPLAIKLSANWERLMSTEQIVNELEQGLDILSSEMADLPEGKRCIRCIFDQSSDLLDDEEKKLFWLVSIFQGGFTADAAKEVTGARPLQMASLVDRGLIQVITLDSDVRYEIHELMRQYLSEKLVKTGLRDAVAEKHSTYYMDFVLKQQSNLFGETPQAAINLLKREIENIRQAWNWSASHARVQTLGEVAKTMAEVYTSLGLFREGKRAFDMAIRYVEALEDETHQVIDDGQSLENQRLLAHLYVKKASLALWGGEYEQVIPILERTIEYATRTKSHHPLAEAELISGYAQRYAGNNYEAINHHKRAIDLYRAVKDPRGIAQALDALGEEYSRTQKFDKALASHEEALKLYRKIGDKHGQVVSISEVGLGLLNMERFELALAHLEQALILAEELNYKLGIGWTATTLGFVHWLLENHELAWEFSRKGLQVAQEIGQRPMEGYNRNNLGLIHLARSEYDEAQSQIQRARELFQEAGNKHDEPMVQANLGLVEIELGHYSEANDHLQQALTMSIEFNNLRESARIRGHIGMLYHRTRQFDNALSFYDQAILELTKVYGRLLAAQFLVQKAELLYELGRQTEAYDSAKEGVEMAQEFSRKSTIEQGHRLLEKIKLDQSIVE